MSDEVQARVEVRNGELVLVDPVAVAVMEVVQRYNDRNALQGLLNTQKPSAVLFSRRYLERGTDSYIVVFFHVNEDGPLWPLVDALLPGHGWEAIRARGEVPVARGLCSREGVLSYYRDVLGMDLASEAKRHEIPVLFGAGKCFAFLDGRSLLCP